MKHILMALFVMMFFFTSANATHLYSCIDENGKEVVTNNPKDTMTDCVLKDSYEEPGNSQNIV